MQAVLKRFKPCLSAPKRSDPPTDAVTSPIHLTTRSRCKEPSIGRIYAEHAVIAAFTESLVRDRLEYRLVSVDDEIDDRVKDEIWPCCNG